MAEEQPSYISDDKELLDLALSIGPRVLSHFRLLEQPYRGGPDFRYLYTTDQVQEVLIQAVELSVSRTAPFTLTGPYGTGKSTIITRTFALLNSQPQYTVKLITLHRGVTRNCGSWPLLVIGSISPYRTGEPPTLLVAGSGFGPA